MTEMRFLIKCSWFLVLISWAQSQNASVYLALLQKIQHPAYLASIRPSANEGPDVVEVDVELKSIGPVSETDMVSPSSSSSSVDSMSIHSKTWTTSFFLRQEWTDDRLKLLGGGDEGGGAGVEVVGGDMGVVKLREESLLDSLWQPDLFFSNSKEGLRHQLTVPNRLLHVNVSSGRVLSTQRLTVVLHCEMDQGTFPHDNQTLILMMESFSYNTDELVLKWSPRKEIVNIQPMMYIPDFYIVGVDITECDQFYSTGTYPCLTAMIQLHRKVAYYIFHAYIPTILIVILSWASFWIDHDAAPARVSVGLLTVLTITTQLAGSRAQMPKVPYIKAIDVWMSVNLLFVFAAYMEYALVAMLARQYKKAVTRKALQQHLMDEQESSATPKPGTEDIGKTKTKTTPSSTPISSLSNPPPPLSPSSSPPPPPLLQPRPHSMSIASDLATPDAGQRMCNWGRLVDKRSRILFPLAYLIFNVVYWVYYLVLG